MSNKVISFQCYETISIGAINAMLFVDDFISKGKSTGTTNKDNIIELMKLCFSYVPSREECVIKKLLKAFPECSEKINKYSILL